MSTISIDWSKAPEGATHWGPDTEEWSRSWRIVQGEQMAVMLDDGEDTEWTWYPITDEHRENLFPTLVARPAAWSGEGLPPPGIEFESLWSSIQGTYAKAFAIGLNRDGGLVYQLLETPSGERVGDMEAEYRNEAVQGYPVFRPLRTPEQIAAEAREASVKQMMKDVCCVAARDIFEDLYDAGYRKVDPAGAQP